MKKVILILGLMVLIFSFSFSSFGQKVTENHFTVEIDITNNLHPPDNLYIYCLFVIYHNAQWQENINVPLEYTGDGTYIFYSDYGFDQYDTFYYYITGADNTNSPYTDLYKSGNGNPTNWYIDTSRAWSIPK